MKEKWSQRDHENKYEVWKSFFYSGELLFWTKRALVDDIPCKVSLMGPVVQPRRTTFSNLQLKSKLAKHFEVFEAVRWTSFLKMTKFRCLIFSLSICFLKTKVKVSLQSGDWILHRNMRSVGNRSVLWLPHGYIGSPLRIGQCSHLMAQGIAVCEQASLKVHKGCQLQ